MPPLPPKRIKKNDIKDDKDNNRFLFKGKMPQQAGPGTNEQEKEKQ